MIIHYKPFQYLSCLVAWSHRAGIWKWLVMGNLAHTWWLNRVSLNFNKTRVLLVTIKHAKPNCVTLGEHFDRCAKTLFTTVKPTGASSE